MSGNITLTIRANRASLPATFVNVWPDYQQAGSDTSYAGQFKLSINCSLRKIGDLETYCVDAQFVALHASFRNLEVYRIAREGLP